MKGVARREHVDWLPALCTAGFSRLLVSTNATDAAQNLVQFLDGPWRAKVVGRANDVLWLAVELASSQGLVTLLHDGDSVKIEAAVVDSLRAALAGEVSGLAEELGAARGTGRLSLCRHDYTGVDPAREARAISALCVGELGEADCPQLAAWLRDVSNVEVVIALLSVLIWAECERLTDAPPMPPFPTVPRLLRNALLDLSRTLGSVHELDHSVQVRVEAASEPHGESTPEVVRDASERPPPKHDDVQFTVYKARLVLPKRWTRLLAFAHPGNNAPDSPPGTPTPQQRVRREAEALLGADTRKFERRVEDSAHSVPHEGEITFVPDFQDIEFKPPFQSFLWTGEIHRAEFHVRPAAAVAGTTVKGQLRVLCGALILAELNLSLRIARTPTEPVPDGLEDADTVAAYRKIFASYSHEDAEIVRQVTQYAHLTGDEYLIDHVALRSGENWSERLKELIGEANIFQLFWSWNSMDSPLVRKEWEYALTLDRPGFVRPTYWETPFPERPERQLPPHELSALHFTSIGRARTPSCRPSSTEPESVAGVTAVVTAGAALVLAVRTGSLDRDDSAAEQLAAAAAKVRGESPRVSPLPDPREKPPALSTTEPQASQDVPEMSAEGALPTLFVVLGVWAVLAGRRRRRRAA